MENLLFSNLVYRIIGEPEKWQEESIEKVNTFVDQAKALDTQENLLELEIANRIIERINSQEDILEAFQTFLEDSRYGLIIVGNQFKHIYHNNKANQYIKKFVCDGQTQQLQSSLIKKIETAIQNADSNSNLLQISFSDPESKIDNIYLKVTQNQQSDSDVEQTFYVLFLPIFDQEKVALHDELKNKYKLSAKEESVIIAVIEGKNIKQIAEHAFLSQNTIKSHLKSIYAKTDTNSQSALIRLFLNHEVQLLESYFDFKMPSFMSHSNSRDDADLFATLANGHTLCYREYGPKNGRPLIVMHNNHSSRFNIPRDYKAICEQTNRRIIIPDRPGYGKSEFIEDYPQNWNTLLSQFIDFLELKEFDLLGSIVGSSLAISYCAHNDIRLNKLILASPIFCNNEQHKQYLGDVLIPAARVINSSKRIGSEIYKLWLKSMSLNVEKHMRHMLSSSLGRQEKTLLNDPDFINMVVKNFNEALQQSSKGSIEDLVFCLKPQQLDLNAITIPVTIWVGDEDQLISVAGVSNIYDPIQNKNMIVKSGYGQDIYYSLFADIIA